MDTFSFFRKSRESWKANNKTRREDYITGGLVALREAEQDFQSTPLHNARLEAERAQSELERVSDELVATRNQSRNHQAAIKQLNEALHQAKNAEASAIKALKKALAEPKPAKSPKRPALPEDAAAVYQELLDQRAAEGSLRRRIAELEEQAGSKVTTPDGQTFPVKSALRRLGRIALRDDLPQEQRLAWIAQNVENYTAALEGHPVKQWEKTPSDSPANLAPLVSGL